jgi:hypothetical protein
VKRVFFNKWVTATLRLSGIIKIQLNAIKILVKVELLYILLWWIFQLFITFSYWLTTIQRSKIDECVTCEQADQRFVFMMSKEIKMDIIYIISVLICLDIMKTKIWFINFETWKNLKYSYWVRYRWLSALLKGCSGNYLQNILSKNSSYIY